MQPSTVFNQSLATVSPAMARSGFSVIDWKYEDFTYTYRSIEQVLENNGFDNISPNEYNQKLFSILCAAGGTRAGYAQELQPFMSAVTEKIMGGTKAQEITFKKTFLGDLAERMNYYEVGMLAINPVK